MKEDFDVERFRSELRRMKPNSPLLKVLTEELPKLSYRIRNAIALTLIPDLMNKMQRWQPIYKVVKTILNKKGYWREKARGNPELGYKTGFGKKKEN